MTGLIAERNSTASISWRALRSAFSMMSSVTGSTSRSVISAMRSSSAVALDPDEVRSNGLADLEERFNGLHEQLYGFRMPGTACEIVNLRAVGYGAVPKPDLPSAEPGDENAMGAVVDEHDVIFDGRRTHTRIFDRARLQPGATVEGPAIVTEFDSTTVVLPGYEARVDRYYNILIDRAR